MAILENIRVKLGVFVTIIIAFSLLLFIVDADTLNFVTSRASAKHNVGEMNGKSIKDRDFQTRNESVKNVLQLLSNASVDEDQAKDATWNAYLEEYVFKPAFEKAGIAVSQAETFDLCQGKQISPVLQQLAIFVDEQGGFSRENLAAFVSSIDEDPSGNTEAVWSYIENAVNTEQLFTKMASLLNASDYSNAIQTRRAVEENNTTSSVDFVMIPANYSNDTTLTVTEQEIRDYYNARKKNLKQTASRDIDYVVFEVIPSQQDVIDTQAEAEKLYEEFVAAEDPVKFAKRNSDRNNIKPGYFYKQGELANLGYGALEAAAFGNEGELTPLFNIDGGYMAGKVVATKMAPDSVYVEHILLQGDSEAKTDSISILAKRDYLKTAEEFTTVTTGESIEDRVRLGWMSQDLINWFGQQYGITGFEQIADIPSGGQIVLKSQFGTHIFRVKETSRPMKKVQVAVVSKDINASKKTRQDIYNRANDLLIASGDTYDGFKAAAMASGLAVTPARRVPEGARTLGNYQNTIEISRWAFDAKAGEVSHIITVDNKYYFVAALAGIHKEGYVPIADIQQDIRMALLTEKALVKQKETVAQKIEGLGTIEEIAEALGTTPSHRDGVAFGSLTNAQQLDPGFVGAISKAQKGVLTGPVSGQIGTYVFVVTDTQVGSFFSEDDARLRNSQISQRVVSQLPQVLATDADLKDYRGRFF